MRKIKVKNSSLFLKCLLLIMFTTYSLLSSEVFAQKKSKKIKPKLDVNIGLASTYDNNILKYSEKYLDRFLNNEDEGRFHIKTYDDIIIKTSLDVASTYRIFGKLKTKFSGSVSRSSYVVNNIKSWNFARIAVQQFLSKKTRINLSYSYIPYFYVRHFRNDDYVDFYGYTPESFKPYEFSKDNFGFWIQHKFFDNTYLRLSTAYHRYFHSQYYTEYDCDNYEFGIKITQPLHEKVKVSLEYQFTISDAKAFDETFETKNTSDDSDASYEKDDFTFMLSWKLPKLFKKGNYITLKSKFRKLYFSSERYLELDRIHAGRVDDDFRLGANYHIRLNKSIKINTFYNWYYRESSTSAIENKQYLADEKNYKQSQIGIKLNYSFRIK